MHAYQKAITRLIELEDTVAELLEELIVSIERGIKLGYSCEGQLDLYKKITNEEYVEEYVRRKAKGAQP